MMNRHWYPGGGIACKLAGQGRNVKREKTLSRVTKSAIIIIETFKHYLAKGARP